MRRRRGSHDETAAGRCHHSQNTPSQEHGKNSWSPEAHSAVCVSGSVARIEGVPTAFVSYSWDSEEHRRWVIALATRLRENGVDVVLDYWNLKLGADKTLFMEKAVRESDHVLLICTLKYKEKADGRLGGVG